MKKLLSVLLASILSIAAMLTLVSCTETGNEDKFDEGGKLIITARNLYFNEWTGGDVYTAEIEKKFNVKFEPTNYSYPSWSSQVNQAIIGGTATDVFHFNLDNYNYANTYKFWADDGQIKPLPDDMSKWPNIKKLLDNTSNINALRYNGKLYCIPIAKNIKNEEPAFSPFTYVYRRDWAKQLGVYQEGDVYTWQQFNALLKAFSTAFADTEISALADVEWGFPSVVNFYKNEPHCFAVVDGQAVASYTTEKYLEGLNFAKSLVDGGVYYADQFQANDGDIAKRYYGGRVGVFYENLSLANYSNLRKEMWKRTEINKDKAKLDDATAIMKVMGPDGKYALEGTDNWFSATFFAGGISDAKQEKILDVMDWLLSDEGTEMAAYGIEGYDYEENGGEVTLLEAGWEKDADGNYIEKYNGAKYLRYMCTLGYDLFPTDPLVDKDAYAILNDWSSYMTEQNNAGKLRILVEDARIKWLTTPNKANNSNKLLDSANTIVMNYAFGQKSLTDYYNTFQSNTWNKVLEEINKELSK